MKIEDFIRGKARRYKGGGFFSVRRKLEDIDSGLMGDYIKDNRQGLFLKNIRREFSELQDVPKSKMLFFDIETCGVDPHKDPIISIAMAHMYGKSDVTVQCLFARDYSEEKTILQYFFHLLPHYEAFFTYNGKSFDVPRLDARAIQNGLFKGKESSIKQMFNGEHYDLYQIGRERNRINLSDARLQTLEKVLFHFERTDDIPGDEIPKVYYEYAYGRSMEARKQKTDPKLWKDCRQESEKRMKEDLEKGDLKNPPKDEEEQKKLAQRYHDYAEIIYERKGGGYRDVYHPGENIDEEDRMRDMARLINHNLLDTVSLAAVLTYLVSGEKPLSPAQSEEDYVPF